MHHLWHRWTKWSEPMMRQCPNPSFRQAVQQRTCKACGLMELNQLPALDGIKELKRDQP